MSLVDLKKLKTFYLVAKLNSFTKAAKVLNTSQPSVSKQVHDMEERLQVKLFSRKKTISLTRQGQVLFNYAIQIYELASKAELSIQEMGNEIQGDLVVSCTTGLASIYLEPYIEGFLRQYPKVRLAIIANDTQPDLEMKEVDMAIRPAMDDRKYIQIPLITTTIALYASPEYLNQYGIPQTIEDLDNHRLIAFGNHRDHPFHEVDWHLTAGCPEGISREAYIKVNLAPNRCKLAEKGFGIANLSKEHPGLENANLMEVLPHIEKPKITAYIIYSKEMAKSKKVLAFKDYLIYHVKKL